MSKRIEAARELIRIARSLLGKGAYKVVTQKQISNWENAKDVTHDEIIPDKDEIVAISRGSNGVNGCVYKDRDGNLYKITERCTNIFRIV